MNVLGIDIGTKSVKGILSNTKDKTTLNSSIKDTNSTIINQNQFYHEQNVDKIFETIREILNEMKGDGLNNVRHIGISRKCTVFCFGMMTRTSRATIGIEFDYLDGSEM